MVELATANPGVLADMRDIILEARSSAARSKVKRRSRISVLALIDWR